jgi:hypothetical protein
MLKTSLLISGVFMLISNQLFSQKKEQTKADLSAPKHIKKKMLFVKMVFLP